MTKDKHRDFVEYQTEQGNLEKRPGKEKDTRQAKAEYRVSEQGQRTIASFFEPNFQNIKNMITWKPKTRDISTKNEEKPQEES